MNPVGTKMGENKGQTGDFSTLLASKLGVNGEGEGKWCEQEEGVGLLLRLKSGEQGRGRGYSSWHRNWGEQGRWRGSPARSPTPCSPDTRRALFQTPGFEIEANKGGEGDRPPPGTNMKVNEGSPTLLASKWGPMREVGPPPGAKMEVKQGWKEFPCPSAFKIEG